MEEWARNPPTAPKDTLDLVREGVESGALELVGKQEGYGLLYYVYVGYGRFYACVMDYGCFSGKRYPISVEVIPSCDIDLYVDIEEKKND